ncbi:MAG: 30S ribosomal protein S12 methylthiotransferase RimO [bacterium]|jgi:ribosomal protein S12 methylthiotransferase
MGKDDIHVGLVSLGCSKNLVDSEVMLGLMDQAGFTLEIQPEYADVIIINTCGFIESAKRESFDNILQFAQYKRTGRCKALIVTGCLVQRYSEEIARELPEIDALLGTGDYDRIVTAIEKTLDGKKFFSVGAPRAHFPGRFPRVLSQAGATAYLKIAEGCSNHCSYCVIPGIRGPQESRTIEEIIAEAEALTQLGVRELILIAQDTTMYGEDLYGKPALADLLRRLTKIKGIYWLRFLYANPGRFSPELVQVMKEEEKVLNYIDLPLQHINDEILKKMHRPYGKKQVNNLLSTLREEIPDVTIRTSFMVGFPGEGDKEFAELLAFINDIKFDRVGFFIFSAEEGTKAIRYPNQVSQIEKEKRYQLAMETQQAISAMQNKKWIGREMEVLIEGTACESNVLQCRSYRDAPDIDGLVFVTASEQQEQGRFITVRITAATEYDLVGEVRDEPVK